jgi:hypothetical protein
MGITNLAIWASAYLNKAEDEQGRAGDVGRSGHDCVLPVLEQAGEVHAASWLRANAVAHGSWPSAAARQLGCPDLNRSGWLKLMGRRRFHCP